MPLSAAVLLMTAVGACSDAAGGTTTPTPSASAPPAATGTPDARAALAGRAAAAMDKAYAALYTLDQGGGKVRNVVATVGADGTWKVDVGGGALGGTADVSLVSISTGVYQCTISSATNPITPTCVKLADAGKRVPKEYDLEVQRLFRQWLSVFTDRQAAIAVTEVQPLAGAKGDCFSVDSTAASLADPVDIGIYCYSTDGVLTAARVGFGVLKVVSESTGPATVQLPGAVVAGPPMSLDAPPPVTQPVTPPSLAPSA
ncbi:hypothetical protein SAMN05421748_101152 [Paractinoplanes atraurantiacus]|uniref:Lipoprotein n=2 Tax=Paractinoplanes atraurantiacus TaxID=1036182 RepID=A0A285EYN0_9ACTN|nr:hypothetical protein SAMN05421748_101152 [Actinoplanes atraurantiacus]